MQEDSEQQLQLFFSGLLGEELYTDLLVVEETLYLSVCKYRVPYQLTFDFLKAAVLPYTALIPMEESDLPILEKYLSRYRVRPSNAVHLACMEKEGVTRIVSEDAEFDKVKEVTRVWIPKLPRKAKGSSSP